MKKKFHLEMFGNLYQVFFLCDTRYPVQLLYFKSSVEDMFW